MEKPDIVDRVCEILAYRFDQYVDRWQVIAAFVIAALLMLFSLGLYVRGLITARPKVVQAASSDTAVPQAEKPASPGNIYVYVCGAVNKPGVYRVGDGTRVNAAVALAGGLAADADVAPLNLAKKLTDGERIYIPKIGEPVTGLGASSPGALTGAGGPSAGNANGSNGSSASGSGGLTGNSGSNGGSGQGLSAWNADGKLNLNTATVDDLDKLPGIGPAFASRILDYRQKQNGFTDVSQLKNIQGIGPKTYAKLKPLVYVE